MEPLIYQNSMVDLIADWVVTTGTLLVALVIVIRTSIILRQLHKLRKNWNCGNLTFREARIWIESIIVLSIMFVLIQIEMIGWVWTRHVCDHYRIFWGWHAMHLGALMVSNRVSLFIHRTVLGQCPHSHGEDDVELTEEG